MEKLSKDEIRSVEEQAENFLLAVPVSEPHHEEHIHKRHKKHKHAPKADLKLNSLLDALSVIIVFLIKQYSSATVSVKPNKDLAVPFTVSKEEVTQAVAITVTRKNIMLNDQPIVVMEDSKISDADLSDGGMMINPLFEKLRDEVQHNKKVSEKRGEEFKGIAAFICDRHTPFPLLTQVMYTAGQAELSVFKFVLIKMERSSGPAPAE